MGIPKIHSPGANVNGWNNTDVTVTFACADPGPASGGQASGIKSSRSPVTKSTEGADQSVAGTATDKADNSASTTVSGINIDKTAPTLSGTPTAGPNGFGCFTATSASPGGAPTSRACRASTAPARPTAPSPVRAPP
jgi:large repetitive protein